MSALLGTQGLAYLIFGLTVGLYGLDVYLSDDRRRDRGRERGSGLSARLVIGVMAGALVMTATMVAPSGPQSYGFVSSEFESECSDVVQQGTSERLQFRVGNGGQVPVYVFFEEGNENIEVDPDRYRVGATSQRNGTLTLSAPPETGSYRYFLTGHRYLALLPQSHVQWLYRIHPWLPIVVIDALIGVPVYLTGVALIGRGRVRRRDRDGPSRTVRTLSRLK